MSSSVIVGVDGQRGGRDAAALARSITPIEAPISLAHVCLTDPLPSRGSNPAFEFASAEAAIELLHRERKLSGRESEVVRVAAGSVGAGLDLLARERDADLIVVGACHRHLIGRVVAGDDTASVLHHAHCAVAMAPAGYAAESHKIETVGVAYDDSPESEVALAFAKSLASSMGATVVGRVVVTPRVYGPAVLATVGYPVDQVAAAREHLGDLGGVRYDIVEGGIGPELAEFSKEVDLLVCGSRQNGIVKRIALGSTSDYLAHHARCPLVVTPAGDRAQTKSASDQREPTLV